MKTVHRGGCTCQPCKRYDVTVNIAQAPQTWEIMVSAVNEVFSHIKINGQPIKAIQVPENFMRGQQPPKRQKVTRLPA